LVDFATLLSFVRTQTRVRHLPHQCLVHQAVVYFCRKNGFRKFNTVYFLTSHVHYRNFHHFTSACGLPFGCRTNEYQAPFGTRHRTFDSNQIFLRVNAHHFQILGGETLAAHVAGHPLPLENMRRPGGRADGTGRAPTVGLTVGFDTPGKTVPFDNTGKAAPFRFPGYVDLLTDRKLLTVICWPNSYSETSLVRSSFRVFHCGDAVVFFPLGMFIIGLEETEMTAFALGEPFFFGLTEADLDGRITICFFCLDLCHKARSSLNDRHRCHNTSIIKHLAHAKLHAQ
jgi:hypothetical protein